MHAWKWSVFIDYLDLLFDRIFKKWFHVQASYLRLVFLHRHGNKLSGHKYLIKITHQSHVRRLFEVE